MNKELELEGDFRPSEVFHENSKLRSHQITEYSWINRVNSDPQIRGIISRPYAKFRGYPYVDLAREPVPAATHFEEVIFARRSSSNFTGGHIKLKSLSKLLHIADGISASALQADGSEWNFRTAPSAGALYPIEIYCICNMVEGVAAGLYFYRVQDRGLVAIDVSTSYQSELIGAIPKIDKAIRMSGVCVILTSVIERSRFKYGERAYRFALIEAGHIAQNLLLAAESEGLRSFPTGGFLDDRINSLIGINGVTEAVQYCIFVGTKN